jgi:hypothetical protein
MLVESDAFLQTVDSFADTILKVMSAHPHNADIAVTCCAAFVGMETDCKKHMYDFASPATTVKTFEKALSAQRKSDLRVVGVILNTLDDALPGQVHRELVLKSELPKLLVEVVGIHADEPKIVRTVANYIASICHGENNTGCVALFSRLGAIEKLCAALPSPPLLDMFDSPSRMMERWDVEQAIKTLSASSPRDKRLVEVLLGKERAAVIFE